MTLPPADPPPAALPPLLKDNPRLEQWGVVRDAGACHRIDWSG
jgi:hypothetical protein